MAFLTLFLQLNYYETMVNDRFNEIEVFINRKQFKTVYRETISRNAFSTSRTHQLLFGSKHWPFSMRAQLGIDLVTYYGRNVTNRRRGR